MNEGFMQVQSPDGRGMSGQPPIQRQQQPGPQPMYAPQQQAPQGWQQPAPQQPQGWHPSMSPVQPGPTMVYQAEPHMTVAPPQFPSPQQQPDPRYSGMVDPNQPVYAPAWAGGQRQYQQPPAPATVGWAPNPPQGGPQPQGGPVPAGRGVQIDQQGRLFGPGLPQELQGKTMDQALHLYGMMRQGFVEQQRPQMPQPQQRQAPQQQAPHGGIPPQNGPAKSPWSDPEGFFGDLMDRKLNQVLGPVIAQNYEQQFMTAANTVRTQFPEAFAAYEPLILERMQGLPPETLANPAAWMMALSQVVGEVNLRGPQQPQRPQQPQPQGGWNPQPRAALPWDRSMPAQVPNPDWQPSNQLPAGVFFSESPSAAMGGYGAPGPNGGGQMMLSPQQAEVSRRFGLSEAQYVQGMGAGF